MVIDVTIVTANCYVPREFWIQLECICVVYLAIPLEGRGAI